MDLSDNLAGALDTVFPSAGPLLVAYKDGTLKAIGAFKGPLFDDLRILARIQFTVKPAKAMTMAFKAELVFKSICLGVEHPKYGCTGLKLDKVPPDSPALVVYRELADAMNAEFKTSPVPFADNQVGFIFGATLSAQGLQVSSEINSKLQILGLSILEASYRLLLRVSVNQVFVSVDGRLSILSGLFQIHVGVTFSNWQFAAFLSFGCGNLGQLQQFVTQRLAGESNKLLRDLATCVLKVLPKSVNIELNLMLGLSNCFQFEVALDWFDVKFALRVGDELCGAKRKRFRDGSSLEHAGGNEEDGREAAEIGGIRSCLTFFSGKTFRETICVRKARLICNVIPKTCLFCGTVRPG